MALDWHDLQTRYEKGARLASLSGDAMLEVTAVDDAAIYLKGRLWRDALERTDLENAVELLVTGLAPDDPIEFAEALRRHYSEGPQARPGCSRVPNMAAVVLKDLGYFQNR
jgi:hypothetical protein